MRQVFLRKGGFVYAVSWIILLTESSEELTTEAGSALTLE